MAPSPERTAEEIERHWLANVYAGDAAELYTVPVASGLIAGESLTGVLIALLTVAGIL